MIGKYILENWVNGDFVSNTLRYINSENKKYLISDVQRSVRSWDVQPYEYAHVYRWAAKFFKDKSELGFRRSVTHLDNEDGVMTYSVFNSPSECICKYSFQEVFGNDLRDIQHPEDSPLYTRLNMIDCPRAKTDEVGFFKVWMSKAENDQFNLFLKTLFNAPEVFRMYDFNEDEKQSILSKTATLFQITHFGQGKKSLSREGNKHNHTILFWLFEDRLVYQFESGKKTW